MIVELTSEKEDEYWEEGAEDSLSSIIPVRSELAGGDPHLGMELARRFRGERDGSGDEKGCRTAAELQVAARRHRE